MSYDSLSPLSLKRGVLRQPAFFPLDSGSSNPRASHRGQNNPTNLIFLY